MIADKVIRSIIPTDIYAVVIFRFLVFLTCGECRVRDCFEKGVVEVELASKKQLQRLEVLLDRPMRHGFDKDKSGEKLAESEEGLLEHRTDAFDTLYIGREKFPYREAFSLPTSEIL